jgi:transposase-like protein
MKVERLIQEIKKESGIDLFRNTNKRQYVEVRALFSYFLRNYFGFKLQEIVEIYKKNGFSTHHATILYANKNYKEVYLPFSRTLRDLDEKMYIKFGNHNEVKLRTLKMRIDSLPENRLDEAKRLIEELIN